MNTLLARNFDPKIGTVSNTYIFKTRKKKLIHKFDHSSTSTIVTQDTVYQTDKIAVYRVGLYISNHVYTMVVFYTPDYLRGNC